VASQRILLEQQNRRIRKKTQGFAEGGASLERQGLGVLGV